MRKMHVIMLLCLFGWGLLPGTLHASGFKVFVVMSYDNEYGWCQEIKEGIDEVLAETCTIEYFWMDTKKNLAAGEEKAKKAYEFYQKFQPDGVIAADDNVQSMFVVPYLKDKVNTPVIFCGVNADAEIYGYPASNVTGILERLHIRKSITFAQQLLPSIKKMAYIMRESPSSKAVFKQYKAEFETYPVISVAFRMPKTLEEAVSMVREFKNQSDAIFFESMDGIRDNSNKMFIDTDVIPILSEAYGKPLISNTLYHVEYGTLCAVIKTGQEQGETAAKMLLKAMQGTPISQIPITRNQYGKKVINLRVMKSMGIRPRSEVLKGAQLLETGN